MAQSKLENKEWRKDFWKVHNFHSYLLETGVMSDVEFVVGSDVDKKSVKAHKFILAMRSSVFQTMFSDDWVQKQIEIPDSEPETFTNFLKFLYKDVFVASSVEDAIDLLYLGSKYNIKALVIKCTSILRKKITSANVIGIHRCASVFDEAELQQTAFQYILENAFQVFREEEFLSIEVDVLRELIRQDDLRIFEKDLFLAILKWTTRELDRKSLEDNVENMRHILADKLLPYIRFLLMNEEEFATLIVGSGILKMEEEILILRHFLVKKAGLKSNLPPLPFPSNRRNYPLGREVSEHFSANLYLFSSVSPVKPGGHSTPAPSSGCVFTESLEFQVDRDIQIRGIGLFGPGYEQYENGQVRTPSNTLDIEVALSAVIKGKTCTTAQVKRTVTSTSDFEVLFKAPKKITAGKIYRLTLAFTGRETQYGVTRLSSTKILMGEDEVKFNFISRFIRNTLLGIHESPGRIRSIVFSPDVN